MNSHQSSSTPRPSKPSGRARLKHSRSRQPSTSAIPNQLALPRKTDDASVPPGVHEHQPAGQSIYDIPTQPYLQIARSWATRDPTRAGVHGLDSQEVTPMDRWISQDIRDEMWNDVHGVYGTYKQQEDVGAVEDEAAQSGEAVHGSTRGST